MTISAARTGDTLAGSDRQAPVRPAGELVTGQVSEDVVTPQGFKDIFRRHPAGVAVVALAGADRLVGFTATSVISVSADPPYLAFSLDSGSSSWPAVAAGSTVAVSFLSEAHTDVARRFATSGIDRFADGGWTALPTGEPVIDGATWVRGRIERRVPVGSSYLVTLLALEASVDESSAPLTYVDRAFHTLN